jgi:hypothetical protein
MYERNYLFTCSNKLFIVDIAPTPRTSTEHKKFNKTVLCVTSGRKNYSDMFLSFLLFYTFPLLNQFSVIIIN